MKIEISVDNCDWEPEVTLGISPNEWLKIWPEDEYPGDRDDCRNMKSKTLEISYEKFREFVKENMA